MHSFSALLLLLFVLTVGVFGDGEVVFLSKPPNVEFRGHEECSSIIVKDICSTSLGFTTYQVLEAMFSDRSSAGKHKETIRNHVNTLYPVFDRGLNFTTNEFSGLYIKSPFNFAEAVVVVAVHGVPSLGISEGHTFPFITDSPMDEIWATLESKILERYPYSENQSLVEINFDEDLRAAEINLNKGSLQLKRPNSSFLNEDENEDSSFISQIALWRAILDKIKEKGVPADGLPDLYWFNLRGLHPILDIYGENSNTATEARQLVASTILQTKETFDEAYQNKTLFLVLSSDVAHTRRVRRAANAEVVADLNVAETYDENYPVFFNIFLWFTIAFIMTIIAISMVTAGMDPGRDSIIYRMTSTRMKKDN